MRAWRCTSHSSLIPRSSGPTVKNARNQLYGAEAFKLPFEAWICASLAGTCHASSDQKKFDFLTLTDSDQRLRWLAVWLSSGFQTPLLSKTFRPICITCGSIHKRSHAIWSKDEVKQKGMWRLQFCRVELCICPAFIAGFARISGQHCDFCDQICHQK